MAERIVKIESCYVGLLDLQSSVNRAGIWEAVMTDARTRAAKAGADWAALWFLNELWSERAQAKELLVWITLFHGIFKVSLELVPGPPVQVPRAERPGPLFGDCDRLICPSGRLAVLDLAKLGEPDVEPILTVEPGEYEVGLVVDREQESTHEWLEQASEYPATDGPDWLLRASQV